MTETSPAKVAAGCLGLSAFAIALIVGLVSGGAAADVLERAVISMFVCFLVGYVIGLVGERAVNDAAARYRDEHPVDISALHEAHAISTATHDESNDAPVAMAEAAT